MYKEKKRWRGGGASVLAGFTVKSAESKRTWEGVWEQTTRKTFIHQHTNVAGLYQGPKTFRNSSVVTFEIGCQVR